MFEQMNPLGIALRVSIMYVYALALVRISGKQSLGQLNPMDLIVTLIIGDLFDDVFWTEIPILQGLVTFALVIALHMLVTFVSSRNKAIFWLIASPARELIAEGRLVQESLRLERMHAEEVQSELRLNGEEHPREIKESRLEPNGQVSVIKDPSNKPVQKKDQRLFG
jgi:uncharacterized membrane protein YcaP (DUF421 family)